MESRSVKIGDISLGRVWLAPMAGYTDVAFRTLARRHGASLTVTEMVSTRGIVHGSGATGELTRLAKEEKPSCIQLFGSDPNDFAVAAKTLDCDIIDINMGCPMPKIVKNGDGAALLKNPELAGEIVRAAVKASGKPVTVKTRLGYERGKNQARELIMRVADGGASAVTVHGRYAEQRYEGRCDLDMIKRLADTSPIPVIASGDICRDNLGYALDAFKGVMIGRAALSDIGVFSGKRVLPEEYARDLMQLLSSSFDERYTINQARKFFVHIFKGEKGSKALRAAINEARNVSDIYAALDMLKSQSGIDKT